MKPYSVKKSLTDALKSAIKDNDAELAAAYIKDIYNDIYENTYAISGDILELLLSDVDYAEAQGSAEVQSEIERLANFCNDRGIDIDIDYISKDDFVLESVDSKWSSDICKKDIFKKLRNFLDEISCGPKGSYTKASDYEELGNYIEELSAELSDVAQDIIYNYNDYKADDSEHIEWSDEIDDYYDDSYLEGDSVSANESLNERELSKLDRSISKIFVDNLDKINSTHTLPELISLITKLLSNLNSDRTEGIFKALNSKKSHTQALQYIYNFILKGDDVGVIKEQSESINEEFDDISDIQLVDDTAEEAVLSEPVVDNTTQTYKDELADIPNQVSLECELEDTDDIQDITISE